MSLTAESFDINNLTLAQRRAMAEEFLSELGAGLESGERVLVCQKPDAMKQGFWMRSFQPDSTQLDLSRNIYTCIAAVNPVMKDGEKVWERKVSNFQCGLALCVDDVGSGKGSKGNLTVESLEARLAPTAVVETSPGNAQVWYFFDKPERDRKKFKNFLVSFIGQIIKEGGDKLDDPVRVMRAPFGINNKRLDDGALKYGEEFEVRLISADYDRRYSIDQICEAFDVEIRESRKYESTGVRKERGNRYDDALFDAAVEKYRAAGAIKEEGEDKYVIPCPWGAEHSSGDDRAFLSGPRAADMDHPYTFHCYHSSCQEKHRTWAKFVVEAGLVDEAEKAVSIADAELDRIARESLSGDWALHLFGVDESGDYKCIQVEDAKEQHKAEQDAAQVDVPETAADAMKKRVEERKRLKAKATESLGVGVTNWDKGWVYSIGEGRVCRPGNSYTYDKKDFNAAFGSHFFQMSAESKLGNKNAYDFVQNAIGFQPVAATAYVMGRDQFFEADGRVYLNLFDERSVPPTAEEYTPEGIAAIETIRYHLRTMFGNEASAERIESWIAMNVQKPGELIGFAPLVKGIEGDGKTIIFQVLMGALLGGRNVGQVHGDSLAKDGTVWAKGRAVVAIEEIKAASGESRYQVTNLLKPYLTNAKVDIVGKWVKLHETINATNYVGMTNFANALPLKDGDRRWMVEFTQWRTISEFIAKEGVAGLSQDKALAPYFDRILWAIREQGPQLRKFFMEYRLMQGMKWGMRAPDTDSKRLMVGIESSDSGLDKIKVYLAEGALGVSDEIVSTSLLNDHIARDTGEKRLMTRQIAMMMLELGYAKVPWDLKWEKKAHTVYVKDARVFEAAVKDASAKDLVNHRLRKLLDATKTKENEAEHVPRDGSEKRAF